MADFPLHFLDGADIQIDDTARERLNIYANLLIEWNKKMNLTAITEPQDVVIKHFLDSLTFFKCATPKHGAKIIDVGTGAGFPGMVLKIARPDLNITLLDGLNKRLVFLNEVAKQTGLDVELLHLRAEEGGRKENLRENYDFACARAVAPLNVLLEYCAPFVKKGGNFVALKGPAASDEVATAKNAAKILGMDKPTLTPVTLTGEEERYLINYKKISQTASKYPRISAKISKSPL